MTTLLLVIAWIALGGWALAGIVQTIIWLAVSLSDRDSRAFSLFAIFPILLNVALPIALLALAINLISTHVGA